MTAEMVSFDAAQLAAAQRGMQNLDSDTQLFIKLFQPYTYGYQEILDRLDSGEFLSSMFDPAFCRAGLEAAGVSIDGPQVSDVARAWIANGVASNISPSPLLNTDFYLSKNADVRRSEARPIEHFILHGWREGRPPSQPCVLPFRLARQAEVETGVNYTSGFFAKIPCEFAAMASDPTALEGVLKFFQTELVLNRAGLHLGADPADPVEVFWKAVLGCLGDVPFSVVFNPHVYRRNWNAFREAQLNERESRLEQWRNMSPALRDPHHAFADGLPKIPRPMAELELPFLHFMVLGRDEKIVPTDIFDAEHYLSTYRDMQRWPKGVWEHYALHGYKELRSPSAFFNPSWYSRVYSVPQSESTLMHYALHGEKVGNLASDWVNTAALPDPEPGVATKLDYLAARVKASVGKLESDKLRALIERAAEIEPLIMRPYGPRRVQLPPAFHSRAELTHTGRILRKAVAGKSADTVVLIPHCRIAGSARVAGTFVRMLQEVEPQGKILIVATELSDFERPDWFGENIELVILNDIAKTVPQVQSVTALVDLLRGVAPRRVVNINSRLGWDTYVAAAKALSGEMDLYAYLFCWDLDQFGNKGGYPIRYFQQAFDYLAGVMIDNSALVDEFRDRYFMSPKSQERLCLAHTPAENPFRLDLSRQFEVRRRQGRNLKLLWSGRFDRQKRFDIVIDIARMRPDIEIWAYGKAVLADHPGLNLKNIPANLRLMGTYEHFDDLPIASCDGFLYTSQWDGLPTILIDVASRGLPIIAAAVGGTKDLIRPETTKPVRDYLNPQAYIDVIDAMVEDPARVTEECQAMISYSQDLCSEERYRSQLRKVLRFS